MVENRERGGSRFNLRWAGSIPADQLTPESLMLRLADYVDFSGEKNGGSGAVPAAGSGAPAATAGGQDGGSTTAQLKRGMKMEEVTTLLGPGKQLSESVGNGGLKTQVFEYLTSDRRVEATYVDGLLVRFSINSK